MAISSVRLAQIQDRNELAKMRVLLWPSTTLEEQLDEVDAALGNKMTGTLPMAILVSHDEDGALTGFLEVALRSHADGCDPARPVGFVEGWFVQETFRNRGVGAELMRSAEDWARSQGCLEMASDALIENDGSQFAHEALGFEVVDRCVHFRKSLFDSGWPTPVPPAGERPVGEHVVGEHLVGEHLVGEHLVLYDGVCGLCNRLNKFVLARDPRGVFAFASLQSETGRSVLQRFGRNPDGLNTFYLVTNYRSESPALLSKSGAALFVAGKLEAPWRWLGILGVLPRAFLDRGYDLIARHRYRLFGRYESCLLPTAEFRKRFIDL